MNAQVDILLKMRADLAGARQATEEMKRLQKESNSFGAALKTGFGISIAQRAISIGIGAITTAFREAFQMASELRGIQENLGIDIVPYQVLKDVVEDTGTEVGVLNKALIEQNKSLFEAGQGGGRAFDAYRKLGLSVATLKSLTPEQQFEAIAVSIAGAGDKQEAFAAASEILGSKNLPKLKAALAEVADKGYGKIAQEAGRAGKVLSPEAAARLNAAAQSLKDAKEILAVKVGEDFASLLGFLGQEIEPPKPTPPPSKQEIADAKQREKDILAEADATRILSNARLGFAQLTADPTKTDTEKRKELVSELRLQAEQLDRANEARFRELEGIRNSKDLTAEQIKMLEKSNETQAEAIRLRAQAKTLEGGGVSAFARSRERFEGVDDPAVNKNRLSAGEGVGAGAADFVSGLGSTGEQVAQTLETTLGQTVSGISDGIYGWVTGTQSFGDALLNLGDTVFRTFINSIVQMGVQWLVTQGLILTGMRTVEATGDALRAGRIVKENAAEAATLPAKTAGATAAGISSYGVAIAFGIAAIAMIAALSGGFAAGGPVSGPGTGTSDSIFARLSNGEFVMPAAAVQRIGLPTLEAMRFNRPAPAYAMGGPVGSSSSSGGGMAGNARPIVVNNLFDKAQLRAAMYDDEGEAHLVDIMQRNKWRLGS